MERKKSQVTVHVDDGPPMKLGECIFDKLSKDKEDFKIPKIDINLNKELAMLRLTT